MPVVPAMGQGGAGEILSLSHLFMALAEEAEACDQGRDVPGQRLAGGHGPRHRCRACRREAASTWRRGFSRSPSRPSTRRSTISTRRLPATGTTRTTAGRWSAFATWWRGGHGAERRPYQAPVSYRIVPRMLGQARRAASLAAEVAAESLQAVTDNPVWVDDADEDHPFGRFVTQRRLSQPPRGARHGRRGRCVGQSLRARRTPRREAARRRRLAAAPPAERARRRRRRPPRLPGMPADGPDRIRGRSPPSTPRRRCCPAANPAASGRTTWRAPSSSAVVKAGPRRAAASTWRWPASCRSRCALWM